MEDVREKKYLDRAFLVYNNEYDRKLPCMIDNKLRHDAGKIIFGKSKRIKKEMIGGIEFLKCKT